MSYKEKITQKGLLIKKVYEKEKDKPLYNLKKGKARQNINERVFDIEDAIADNNKLITLLMTIIMKLYDVDFDKTLLSDDDQFIIDSFLELFRDTVTRFSLQFENEGYNLLYKLLTRQQQVADYIKSAYELTEEGEEESNNE